MSIIADIASGEVDMADLFFLIATILAVVAAVLYTRVGDDPPTARWAPVALSLAVGCVAFAWLML